MIAKVARGSLLAVLAGFLVSGPARAQLEDNLTSLSDEQVVGYLGPLVDGLSSTMNAGIFKTGSVPISGLELTLDLKAAYVSFSDEDRVFATPTSGGFEQVDAPTIVGDTQSVSADHQSVSGLQFAYPGGFDMSGFAVAAPQLTIGSVLGTRAMIRYISLSFGEDDEDLGDFKLVGVGGQHSISQYLPGVPVNLAVGIMWQSFKIGDGIVDASALAFNVTGSKRYGRGVTFEPYAGLGIDSFEMTAEYDSGGETVQVVFDRANDPHLTLGAGLNLPVVKLHAELNVAAVSGFAGGLSFGI